MARPGLPVPMEQKATRAIRVIRGYPVPTGPWASASTITRRACKVRLVHLEPWVRLGLMEPLDLLEAPVLLASKAHLAQWDPRDHKGSRAILATMEYKACRALATATLWVRPPLPRST